MIKSAVIDFAPVAQSVERIHGKDEVSGSIPLGSSREDKVKKLK